MKSMKFSRIYLNMGKTGLAALGIALLSINAKAQNILSVTRTDMNSIELRLENGSDIAGIQFSIQSSSPVALSGFQRGDRISDGRWLVATHQPNDSTLNVIILGSSQLFLGSGSGTIAKISYRTNQGNNDSPYRVSLGRVVMANCKAESIAVTVQNLEWGLEKYFAKTISGSSFKLGQNFPNPFNPATSLAYTLSKPGQVRLSVYDVTGREINRLVDSYQFVGTYSARWNSNDTPGGTLPSGVYFARLQVDGDAQTLKMILAK
jgi:hypothetical protein